MTNKYIIFTSMTSKSSEMEALYFYFENFQKSQNKILVELNISIRHYKRKFEKQKSIIEI